VRTQEGVSDMSESRTYRIPCSWREASEIEVEAPSLSAAIARVDSGCEIPDGSYVGGSFDIDLDMLAIDYPGDLAPDQQCNDEAEEEQEMSGNEELPDSLRRDVPRDKVEESPTIAGQIAKLDATIDLIQQEIARLEKVLEPVLSSLCDDNGADGDTELEEETRAPHIIALNTRNVMLIRCALNIQELTRRLRV